MSNHDNPRRGDIRRSEHGPRWENGDPGAGCNSTHVARARAGWKQIKRRKARRAEYLERVRAVAARAEDA